MNKLTIPALLAGVVMIAGAFAFMPVQQASTVHTTILADATGLGCATEAVDLLANADNDTIAFTFTQAINLTSVQVQGAANLAGDTIGFDAVTIDGENAIATVGVFEEILDDAPDLSMQNEGPFTIAPIYIGSTMTLTIDDNDGSATEVGDDITFIFCGIVENAGNFDDNDVSEVVTAV